VSYLRKKLLPDFRAAIMAWHVWTHMGVRDVKNRYRGTVVGLGWMFFSLAALTGSIALVYGPLFGMDVREFLPFLVLGLIIWGFIYTTFLEGSQSFIIAEGYIKQMVFPKQVYILRSCVSALLTASPGLVIYVFLVPLLWPVGWGVLWFFPGLAILVAASLGHSWIMSYLSTRYRDLPHAVGAVLQIFYFLTPIIYPEEMMAKRGLHMIYDANPFYWLVTVVRHPLLRFETAPGYVYALALGYCIVVWVIALAVGALLDRKVVYYL
jgi:ABC-type polysaccharide/polyol phosphate export permease